MKFVEKNYFKHKSDLNVKDHLEIVFQVKMNR